MHADPERLGEFRLAQPDETPQGSHVARLQLAAHDALSLAATKPPLANEIAQHAADALVLPDDPFGAHHPLLRYFSNEPLAPFFENIRSTYVTSKLEHHAEQLSALGHPVRLKILRRVVQAGIAGAVAGDIQAHVDMPASTLSHHLKRLVDAGLLSTRQEGTYNFYAAQYAALRALTEYLWEDCCAKGKGGCC